MATLGNRKVNPNPCTEAEQKANWQLISQIINEGDVTIDPDDFFASINLVNLTYNPMTDTLEVSAAAGLDNFKVKSSGADPTEDYLHDAIVDNATFVNLADIVVACETINEAGNLNEKLFVDISLIPGYGASGFFVYSLIDNITTLLDAGSFVNVLFSNITLVNLTFVGTTLTAVEPYQLIRGLAKGLTITADDATFVIDNVIPLANGNDPVGGTAATEITVQNVNKEAFADDEPITAIHDGAAWEVLLVERRRLVMGLATAAVSTGTASFNIDNIEALASGRDPRTDPTSAAETLEIFNEHSQSFVDNEKLIAIYNVTAKRWEAFLKPMSSSGALELAIVYAEVDAAEYDGTDIAPGEGLIKKFSRPGTPGANWEFVDVVEDAFNVYFDSFPVDTIVWVDSENYIVGAGCTLAS